LNSRLFRCFLSSSRNRFDGTDDNSHSIDSTSNPPYQASRIISIVSQRKPRQIGENHRIKTPSLLLAYYNVFVNFLLISRSLLSAKYPRGTTLSTIYVTSFFLQPTLLILHPAPLTPLPQSLPSLSYLPSSPFFAPITTWGTSSGCLLRSTSIVSVVVLDLELERGGREGGGMGWDGR